MLHNVNLTKTAQGISFDGSIRDAHLCKGVIGTINQATPRFNDGDTIDSSEIVNVDYIPAVGWYIETDSKHRYHIASTAYSAAQTGETDKDMKQKQFHIKTNIDYFKAKQWSN